MKVTRRTALQMAGAAVLPLGGGAQAAQDKITIAYPADVPSWDAVAHTTPLAMPLFKSVYDSPLTYTHDLKLIPNVIRHWNVTGEKGTVIELDFRDDVAFHNGDRLTAEDFRFSFMERQKADPKLPTAGIWKPIEGIEIVSPTKAVVKLSRPMPTAPQWWAFLGSFILPKKYFESVGREGFLKAPVGSGPYKMVEYQQGARIVLEAFDKYWNGKAKIAHVTIQVVKDPTARVAAVESGQADIAKQVPVREALRLAKVNGLVGRVDPISELVMMPVADVGIFHDASVRLAAHHAIDKRALSKAFFNGVARPISIPAPPDSPGDIPGFSFEYSPEKAKELLAKAGYGPAKPAKFKFNTTNGAFANDFDMARAIVGMWQKVGLEPELNVIDLNQYYELSHSGHMPEITLYAGWGNDTADPEIYIGYQLNPKLSFSSWKSADCGEVLDKLFAETDYDKRIAGYKDFEKYAVGKGYSLPLLQGVTTVVHRGDVIYKPYGNGWLLPADLARS
ncbi:MAG TPA: ABC transporter substrate-binding protein [Reyranella sp.]|nr:ABC transporter substrate-binding protein [Reyranella sp.]